MFPTAHHNQNPLDKTFENVSAGYCFLLILIMKIPYDIHFFPIPPRLQLFFSYKENSQTLHVQCMETLGENMHPKYSLNSKYEYIIVFYDQAEFATATLQHIKRGLA